MRRPAGAPVTAVPSRKKTERPELRVLAPITKTRYSRATGIIVGVTALAVLVVMFQTVIAQQQLKLDKITTEVRLARFHYDELRQQRAELRAPDNLREQAMLLGMSQGVAASFSEIPSDVVAMVLAATGSMDKEISQPPMLEDLASQTISGVTP
jgi:cell division protein FtsL